VGGFVGIPIIEGGNKIGEFLYPSVHEVTGHGAEIGGIAHAAEAVTEHGLEHSTSLEIVMMCISLAIAIGGWMLARKLYVIDPSIPERIAEGLNGFYRLVFRKYLVDELYDAIAVRPFKRFSNWLWIVIDDSFIDWLVNYIAEIVKGAGGLFRKIQTGLVQNYAIAILVGIIFIFGYLVFYR
jgi:NADH-quinone oxidoreductase subunit L